VDAFKARYDIDISHETFDRQSYLELRARDAVVEQIEKPDEILDPGMQ